MHRAVKEATVKRLYHDNQDPMRTRLENFTADCNFSRRLKPLSGITPYGYLCKICTSEPNRLILNPVHQMPGMNIWAAAAVTSGMPDGIDGFANGCRMDAPGGNPLHDP